MFDVVEVASMTEFDMSAYCLQTFVSIPQSEIHPPSHSSSSSSSVDAAADREQSFTNFSIGVDEAGRGPVIGPMIYCAFACPAKNTDLVRTQFQCADSKTLKPAERRTIEDKITGHLASDLGFRYSIGFVSPPLISRSMLAKKANVVNLNELSHKTAEILVKLLLEKGGVQTVTSLEVDTVGPCDKYETLLRSRLPEDRVVSVTVSKKADAKYPCVSAASIVAKVCRDSYIDYDSMGSGYPSDPLTKQYMKTEVDYLFGYRFDVVRMSWATAISVMEDKCARVEWEDDEKDDKKSAQGTKRKLAIAATDKHNVSILSFFQPKNKKEHRESLLKKANIGGDCI